MKLISFQLTYNNFNSYSPTIREALRLRLLAKEMRELHKNYIFLLNDHYEGPNNLDKESKEKNNLI